MFKSLCKSYTLLGFQNEYRSCRIRITAKSRQSLHIFMKFLKTLDKDLLELSVKYASRNFVSKKNVMYTSRVTSLLHKVLQRALTG